MTQPGHVPVLLAQVLQGLDLKSGETVIDCTAGRGGHAEAMAAKIGSTGLLLLMDRDQSNLAYATQRIGLLANPPRVLPVHADFRLVESIAPRLGRPADAILADLGFASNQVDDPSRGLAFTWDGPLDMRLDQSSFPSAAELLASASELELADLIFKFGEEPWARVISRTIVRARLTVPILSTRQLADLVVQAYGARAATSRVHPATRTFMALRIAVNDELGSLEGLLDSIERAATSIPKGRPTWLAPGARVGIISFHSLEDRPVKQAFVRLAAEGLAQLPFRKPLSSDEDEIKTNPRSRSAKLRIARLSSR
ncbi:MAG: 16S rRNA (cytosine(1402)-N(4))-methyltransferase RsmH [Phycisphaerales bacterium]|nr:16S rRNA (cytosine(1402)-N(4))-methyltransferase RsmH [Phycisphaerales bacterium]